MTRLLPTILLMTIFFSCDRQPFVEHKIKEEKLNDDCRGLSPSFRITANFGGERFEFDKCLPASFNKDLVKASRHGDTVLVEFPRPQQGEPVAGYRIILDIDSYPVYRVLTIDNDSYNITVTGN
jgi:hypothetical protein